VGANSYTERDAAILLLEIAATRGSLPGKIARNLA